MNTLSKPKLLEDLGMKFPRETSKHKVRYGKYLCNCGKEFVARTADVKASNIVSCGCSKIKRLTTHNSSRTKLYGIWKNIKQRCENTGDKAYSSYGARGIAVCDEWSNDFCKFKEWAENQGYKEGTSLSVDRENNDKGYNPDNCRLATKSIQVQNTKKLWKSNTSGYKGVTFDKQKGKWLASIRANGKNKFLGYYEDVREGAVVRDAYIHVNNLEHTPSIDKMKRIKI